VARYYPSLEGIKHLCRLADPKLSTARACLLPCPSLSTSQIESSPSSLTSAAVHEHGIGVLSDGSGFVIKQGWLKKFSTGRSWRRKRLRYVVLGTSGITYYRSQPSPNSPHKQTRERDFIPLGYNVFYNPNGAYVRSGNIKNSSGGRSSSTGKGDGRDIVLSMHPGTTSVLKDREQIRWRATNDAEARDWALAFR
jgi:hypothetical protein